MWLFRLATRIIKKYPFVPVLLLAALFRLWGIWHDYPYSYYPDEEHFMKRALSLGSGDLNPHWFHKPAFLMYTLFFEYGLFFILGKLTGFFTSVESFAVYFFQNQGPFILIGRLTVAIFGITTVYITYRIADRFWGRTAGLFASLLLALSYGHVFASQNIKADVPATFFTVLSVYYLLKACSEGFRTGDYMLSGLFAGLGTATKYYSIAVLPLIMIVVVYEIIISRKLYPLKKYIVSLVSYWITYFVASPYNFIDPLGRRSTFRHFIKLWNMIMPQKIEYAKLAGEQSSAFHHGGIAIDAVINSIIHYWKVLISVQGMGMVIVLITAVSLVRILQKISLQKAVLMIFIFIFITISTVLNPSYVEPRHQLIIYPFLCVISGIALQEIFCIYRMKWLISLAMAVVLLIPLSNILKHNFILVRPDARTLAKEWIEENINSGTKVLVEDGSVKISPGRRYYMTLLESAEKTEPGQFTVHARTAYNYAIKALPEITYDISYIRFPWWLKKEKRKGLHRADSAYDRDMANPLKPVGVMPYEYYKENGFEYVVVTSRKFPQFLKKNSKPSQNFPSFYRFYSELFRKGRLVKEFSPSKLRLRGYEVKIFKIT
jgi:4-amino-4-deoxy-L-arabinose transferase-like glycosyltransferase